MIKNINSDFQIQNVQNKKSVKSSEHNLKTTTNPIDNYTMKGLESLGVYNMSLVKNKDNFNHEPAELIIQPKTSIKNINGEKVCDPYGKLEYIVQNDGEYETRYYPQKDKPEIVDYVEIKNIYDGKLLKTQKCAGDSWTCITEYSQEQPNISYETGYFEGKLERIEKIEKMPNGSTKYYEKHFYHSNPELNIRLSDKNHKNYFDVSFDSNNVVKDISLSKTVGGNRYNKNITMNKGAVIGVYESKDIHIPNFMERDVLNDTDVLPTDKFDREKLEANAKNSQKDIYSFYGNGRLKEINDKNIKIEFNEDGSQHIIEYLDNGITKTTNYYEDGRASVIHRNGKIEKTLEISSENIPTYYCISEDGKDLRAASFTDEGYLAWCNS